MVTGMQRSLLVERRPTWTRRIPSIRWVPFSPRARTQRRWRQWVARTRGPATTGITTRATPRAAVHRRAASLARFRVRVNRRARFLARRRAAVLHLAATLACSRVKVKRRARWRAVRQAAVPRLAASRAVRQAPVLRPAASQVRFLAKVQPQATRLASPPAAVRCRVWTLFGSKRKR